MNFILLIKSFKILVNSSHIPKFEILGRDIFNTLDFGLNVELTELHTIYHLQMLDITMMTIWCM
jgi:hypothetical protein